MPASLIQLSFPQLQNLDGACIQSVNLVIDEDPRTEITLSHVGEVFMAAQYRISLPYSDGNLLIFCHQYCSLLSVGRGGDGLSDSSAIDQKFPRILICIVSHRMPSLRVLLW